MGWHPRKPMDYGSAYFADYLIRDASPMGESLTRERVNIVKDYWTGPVVDIGIGGGRFVEAMKEYGHGFDVNEEAVRWLKEQDKFCNPYERCVDAITCWDALEHIPDPEALIHCVNKYVFVSLPIFTSPKHVLSSRHYKPGEHLWYWTDEGLVMWFDRLGFDLVEKTDIESVLGRDEIYTYVFCRRGDDDGA